MGSGVDILITGESEPARVLVVEDDPVSAMLIQRFFVGHDIRVDIAKNGAVALELQRQNHYRLVVSDWVMPEIDGVELCRRFRRLHGPYVYFILCSARGQRDDRKEAFDAGVDDFLTKPLDKDEMHGRLKVARRILTMEEDLQRQKAELEATTKTLSEVNRNLTIASRRFEGLFNGLPVACFTFDRNCEVNDWNRRSMDVFQIEANDAFLRPVWEVLSQAGDGPWNPDQVREFLTGEGPSSFDWSFRLPDGSVRYLASSVICLPDISGRSMGAVCANLDITERKLAEEKVAAQMRQIDQYAQELMEMNARLNHLAVTDGLTGLWNQRKFTEVIEDAVSQHDRLGLQFSVVLCDIDHFKRFNDAFGHQVGDEVLREFAKVLRLSARAHEMPVRYGGEEFAIVLRSCSEEDAIAAAERFRKAIESHSWLHRSVTASFGVATSSPERADARVIISQADIALYASKAGGRNRVTHFSAVAPKAGVLG